MCFRNHHIKYCIWGFIIFNFLFPVPGLAEIKSWTGYGGDANWLNPLNWSGSSLPQSSDEVLLDNRDMPVSYLVTLPDAAVVLKTIVIFPSPGRNIELVLPPSNKINHAFTVTGPGYGVDLKAGAIFRNASGLSSGESLLIADSIIIYDGARYIHQTRSSHANSILKFLSTAPGTEQGIFDFDVPKASYTISVSNRIYGSLELHATAYGATVNYTCSGANPLLIHGNLRIGVNVNMSMDLSGTNGNIQVQGDFIQEGGQLNLASGNGDNTILRVMGDLYQSPAATITETTNGSPFLELNGLRMQEIAMGGQILNQVGFRMNNISGSTLRMPLMLPWKLEMKQGPIVSTSAAMLILDAGCSIIIDSSRLMGTLIDGPLRKLGLDQEDHFLFPVGKDGNLRWLELKESSGNYTVEYVHQNPASLGTSMGPGLDHISKLEYWKILADGNISNQAKIELSFATVQSGGVTDPDYLNVAEFKTIQWDNAGHTAITGNFLQGSVLSGFTDFSSRDYTLASVLDLENPLPLTSIDLEITEISEKPVFNWKMESPEIPDHFNLYEETNGCSRLLAVISALDQKVSYRWESSSVLNEGMHYFRIRMVDIQGTDYPGKLVMFKKEAGNCRLGWIPSGIGGMQLLIQSAVPDQWNYEIISMDGRYIKKGILNVAVGRTCLPIGSESIPAGIYLFRATDSKGKNHSLQFKY
jgi:hypothetical protein